MLSHLRTPLGPFLLDRSIGTATGFVASLLGFKDTFDRLKILILVSLLPFREF